MERKRKEDSFKPFSIIPKGNGLSANTNRSLLELNQQLSPAQPQPGTGTYSNPPKVNDPNTVRLPDGRVISTEDYQKLQDMLRSRGR
jgi:hypothetical protein